MCRIHNNIAITSMETMMIRMPIIPFKNSFYFILRIGINYQNLQTNELIARIEI